MIVYLEPFISGADSTLYPPSPQVALVNPARPPTGLLSCSIDNLANKWAGWPPSFDVK